jgi:formylglycine-generating enzyme required for sulfatase activity
MHWDPEQGCLVDAPAPGAAAAAPGDACPAGMVLVPGERILFGTPEGKQQNPLREVLALEVCISRTEVTVSEYAACVSAGRCPPAPTTSFDGDIDGGPSPLDATCNGARADRKDHPINCVNLTMAEGYCLWAGARLPTEREWEHAARGADGRDYPWGADTPAPGRLNACDGDCRDLAGKVGITTDVLFRQSDGWAATAPVGSFPAGASPCGALDMAGNVAEWTSSPLCKGGVDTCRSRRNVVRGGSWLTTKEEQARASARSARDPSARDPGVGFRCAMSPASRPAAP